ncbi:hypothetical protein LZ518_00655 [Sphingomonas sp. RB56-2]|uniref:Uncharacterized protein n=1 Tax=Sphingomonas brevis TaxID=2908206 RepID=A0ABT0S5H8_9SPHN|nr:hypothetical protein [Sphingomonas brevis]MCL6739654.1 hypothetical protein [Sphingomonas brevis]
MKLALRIFGAVGLALLTAGTAAAQQTVIQVVDLAEKGLSTEGGEATLYRVKNSNPKLCKIDVIQFGEEGRSILEFEFRSKLLAAEAREYRYKVPIAVDPKAKPKLTKKTTMADRAGRESLQKEFETYKALFDPADLAKCLAG